MAHELDVVIAAAVPIVPRRYNRAAPTDPTDVALELGMAKSALLYADRVTLASWRVSLVQAWGQLREGRRRGDAADVVRLLAAVEFAAAQDLPAAMTYLNQLPSDELTLQTIELAVGDRLSEIDALLDEALATPSWRELRRAVDLGLVAIRPMGEAAGFGFSREAAIAEYLALVAELTGPGSMTTPMLDFSAAAVLEVGSKVGILRRPMPTSSTEVALASHYMGRLPAFGTASLEAVVNAREALKAQLVRFRSLMAEMAKEIVTSPVDEDFGSKADDLYRREIAPQLQEIAELSRDRRLLPSVGREVIETQGGTIVKASIGLAAAGAAAWPVLAQAAVGAAVVAGDIASGTYKRVKNLNTKRSANKLLWLYEVEERLRR